MRIALQRFSAAVLRIALLSWCLAVSAHASYTLRWSNNDTPGDETGFVVERSDGGGAFAPIATVAATVTTYQDLTANSAITYAYRVKAYNAIAGSGYTNVATNAPTFTTQPVASQTQAALGTAAFSAAASGIPSPSYQWQKNGVNLTDGGRIAGSATAALTVSNLSPADAATYTVMASNGFLPNATSGNSVLTVTQAAQTIAFGALTPASYLGAPIALTATASSGLTVTYASSNPSVASVSASTVTIRTPGTTTITASQAGNTVYLPATSVSQLLTVGPASQTITFGALNPVTYNSAPFALGATASSGLTVSFASSNPSTAAVNGSTITILGTGSVTITASQSGNADYLAAPASQQTLLVNPASQTLAFTALPSQMVAGTGPYPLSATATSGLPVSFSSSNFNLAVANGNQLTVSGSTGGAVTITASQSGSLLYLPAPSLQQTIQIVTNPVFTTQPQNRTLNVGGNTAMTIQVNATPAATYQWQVSANAGAAWSNLSDGGVYSGSAGATLTFTGVTSALNGNLYRCVATNSATSLSSNAATLTVNFAPSIATQPQPAAILAGQNTSFAVVVGASPAPTYQWQVSTTPGGNVFTNLGNTAIYSGVATATLNLTAVPVSLNDYVYQCIVSNSLNTVTSGTAGLTVDAPPAFTTQPSNQLILTGGNASFSVVVTGNPAPTVQWQISADGGSTWTTLSDGGIYSGSATTTLAVTGAALGLNGDRYRAVASNGVLPNGQSSSASLGVSSTNSGGSGLSGGGGSGTTALSQTIAFAPIGSATVGVPVTLSATASSGLAVTFSVVSGNAILNGNTLTASDANPVVVAAAQAGSAVYAAATPASQTLTASPAAAQIYFGEITGSSAASSSGQLRPGISAGTNFAACVNGQATAGTLVGYLPGLQAGFVVNFTLTNGRFTASTSALTSSGTAGQVLTFTGTIAGGQMSGTIGQLGASFSAAVDPGAGGSAASAGLYSTGSTYSIVGTQNELFVLAVTPTLIAAGAGPLASNGTFTLQTSQGATINGTVNAQTSGISGLISPSPTAPVVVFSGTSSAVAPVASPPAQAVNAGGTASLSVAAAGATGYQWQFGGVNLPGATGATLTLANIGAYQGGVYTAVVTTAQGSGSSSPATVAVTVNARLINLSSRGYVAATSSPLVDGFVISGAPSKWVLVRGVGPALGGLFGISGSLPNPALTLFDGTGAVVATDSGWNNPIGPGASVDASAVQPATSAVFAQVYAFPLQPGSLDSAILPLLPAGNYTAQITGANASSGVALAELYDADSGVPATKLVNLSSRALVGPGAQSLAAGFVVSGTTAQTVLVRGIGPALTGFGVAGALSAPQLTVFDSASAPIAANAGWGNSLTMGTSAVAAGLAPATAALMSRVSAFALSAGSADCAMVVTLPPGAYTVQVSGMGGATGVALVEVYDLP